MAHPRRLLWLFLPALVGGAFLLPTSDEFAAVRGGRRVDRTRLAFQNVLIYAPEPRLYRKERIYGFGEEAQGVERALRQGVFAHRGWNQRFQITYPPEPRAVGKARMKDVQWYSDDEAGDSVVLYHYREPVEGVRLVAQVREGRKAWGHLKRRLERMVGR